MIHENTVRRLPQLPTKNSFFLFGARGTGKSTLLAQCFPSEETLFIDLLDPEQEERLARNPAELQQRIAALASGVRRVVIDEVQRQPKLLDQVHRLIETTDLQYVLTGSSSRKLRRGSANMLAGRAFVHALFPFTARELGKEFDLMGALTWGTLPRMSHLKEDEERAQFLRAYALTYLREEIVMEQLVRKLDPFRLFLEVAAQSNGTIVNYSRIAQDTGVDSKSVQTYFEILEETLVGFHLVPFHRSVRARQRSNPKFYFFDTGVARALSRSLTIPLQSGTFAFGNTFEQFLVAEIHRMASYLRPDWRFFYLRTKDDAEIDLIIERPGEPLALVEIKSGDRMQERDCAALARFAPDLDPCECFCLSLDPHRKRIGPVECWHWRDWVEQLFS